jgi:CheY-like chemotaxis protein
VTAFIGYPAILVVDDDADIVWTSCLLLKQAGYDVRGAANALEALERIEERRPDLIILDILMPGMSGIELSEKLRAREDTRHIPIILQSASPVHDRYDPSLYDVALCKPVDFDQLSGAIARLTGTASEPPPAAERRQHA